jgi:hypothetical protein
MSRTLEEIQSSILLKKSETERLNALEVLTTSEKNNLSNLNTTSKVSIWRLFVYIQAFAIFVHETIFDTHKQEIEELIALNKIHNLRWYRGKALIFQLGYSLYLESDLYNNDTVDESLVLASQIVKQASVEELAGRLKIKVAKEDGNGLGALTFLTNPEIQAFTQYMSLVKDAGTRIDIISRAPDQLKLTLDLYFDPLILSSNGERLDGSENEPILKAIEFFLYNLEFNGELILTKFTDYLQLVEGVEMPVINEAFAKYGTLEYSEILETYIADSGYMVIDLDNTQINYIAREL